ncbi:cytochrome P450 71A1-like [Magnolia sinica]|uniref:cytochrome P450 71A1-like n=1 Tax=Magnolia sinica TaxID=86752 RepID=UPI002659113D|nr:cytochrome P450 71A1-like [Magnolia sinica]
MALSTTLSAWLPLLIMIIIPSLPLFLLIHKRNSKRRSKLPPGPPGLPILGNLHQLTSLPHRKFWLLSRKYGPLMHLQLGHVPTLIVSSARIAKEVMKSQDLHFCSRPALVSQRKLSYNFSDVAFAPYGEYWREMRKISIVDLLSTKRVQSFREIRGDEVAKMVASISSSSSRAEPVNLSEMMLSLTYDIVSWAAFGKSYNEGSEDEKMEFHEVLKETGIMLGSFFVADYLPWMWWADVITGLYGRLERSFSKLDAFYERLINEHQNRNKPEAEEDDFVDVLLRLQHEFHLTKDQIKGIIMNVLIAGTETSSTLVVWAMTELMRNPKTMKKAQDEVRRIVGNKGKVEESDLHQLEYLKIVIKETLRLHPPGALLLPRETIQDCRIDGYDVAAKTRVIVNAFAIGRDPSSWENPEEFMPERFTGSSIDYKGQDFELIPFGAGRRVCPGMYFGAMIYELALANLLYSFNWDFSAGMKKEDVDMTEEFGVVVHKKHDLYLVPTEYSKFG